MQRWWGESREGGERSAGPGGRGGARAPRGLGGHGGRWAGMGGGGLGVPGAVAKGEGWRGAASPERRRGFGAPGLRSGAGARARRASGTPGRRLPRVDSGVGVWARGRSARSGRLGRLGSRSGAGGWAQGIGGGLAVGPGGHPGRQPVVAPWAPRTARRRRALWGTGIPDGAQRFRAPGHLERRPGGELPSSCGAPPSPLEVDRFGRGDLPRAIVQARRDGPLPCGTRQTPRAPPGSRNDIGGLPRGRCGEAGAVRVDAVLWRRGGRSGRGDARGCAGTSGDV